jgi:hypothetical protein
LLFEHLIFEFWICFGFLICDVSSIPHPVFNSLIREVCNGYG